MLYRKVHAIYSKKKGNDQELICKSYVFVICMPKSWVNKIQKSRKKWNLINNSEKHICYDNHIIKARTRWYKWDHTVRWRVKKWDHIVRWRVKKPNKNKTTFGWSNPGTKCSKLWNIKFLGILFEACSQLILAKYCRRKTKWIRH